MRDRGVVVSVEQGLAVVEVPCLQACEGCAARSLCTTHEQQKGRLSVRDPLGARPGDEVLIEIPEEHYSRALIQMFASLLTALLVGMGGGYLLASRLALPVLPMTLGGMALGLAIAGFVLTRYFRDKGTARLYPVITEILKKGGSDGPP